MTTGFEKTEYEKALTGDYSFRWDRLNEEQRYGIWSLHIDNGGEALSYPAFCDKMDEHYAKFVN